MSRKINDAGLTLIKKHEGCRLTAYQDTVGVWTIGYGHVRGVVLGMLITQAQANQVLTDDLVGIESVVDSATSGAGTDNQFAAMVSLCFNIGPVRFRRSSVLRFHREGRTHLAADMFLLWDRVHLEGGELRVVEGLTKRREAERELYLTA